MDTEKIINHIVNWLSEYLKNANQKGFVIGISGGIDSAVTSTLCAKTGFPVLCLEMPIHQAQSHVSRAWTHINWLKENFKTIEAKTINLTPTFDSFVNHLSNEEKNSKQQALALANTRARLRMTTLYYYAGINNYLVAGTGNKVEDFGVGFFTKYGDGGVDLSPIADLNKTEVYALAKTLGISQEIIEAKPTDGLFGDDRTDEDQIGATYPELEWAMRMYETHTVEDFTGREKDVFTIYSQRHKANLHKMIPIPVCKIPENLKK